MSFCIVEFTASKEIAVVHKNWFFNEKCYWPNFWKIPNQLDSALKKGTLPDYDTWELHDVKVVGSRFFGKSYLSYYVMFSVLRNIIIIVITIAIF